MNSSSRDHNTNSRDPLINNSNRHSLGAQLGLTMGSLPLYMGSLNSMLSQARMRRGNPHILSSRLLLSQTSICVLIAQKHLACL